MTEDIKKLAEELYPIWMEYNAEDLKYDVNKSHRYAFLAGAKAYEEMLLNGGSGAAQLWLKPRFKSNDDGSFFSGYNVVKGAMLDDEGVVYHMIEALPTLAKIKRLENENKILRRQRKDLLNQVYDDPGLVLHEIEPKLDAELQAELGEK